MLLQNGYQSVSSFGTGTKVSLAGEGRAPNEFRFGTPYATIAADLRGKNEALYTRTRILGMLDRDAKVKPAPERFQDIAPSQRFDLVVTFEAHVYNAVLDELKKRTAPLLAPCHVVNLETPDTLDDASAAALLTLRLVRAVHDAVDPPTTEADAAAAVLARLSQHLPRPEGAGWRADQTHWEDALPPLLAALEVETKKPVHHAVAWV
jgi:RNA polymerase II subunit A C-terminal domain phosphatase SSU72